MFTSEEERCLLSCAMHYGHADLRAVPKMVAGVDDVCNRLRLHN